MNDNNLPVNQKAIVMKSIPFGPKIYARLELLVSSILRNSSFESMCSFF